MTTNTTTARANAASKVSSDGRWWQSLIAVVLAGYALRMLRVPYLSPWRDEELTMGYVTGYDAAWLITELPEVQPHYPVYYLALKAWTAVFGSGYVQARVLSAGFGAATVILLALYTRRLFDARTALYAAAALTIAPFHVYLSTQVRMYSLVAFLTVASFTALHRLEEYQRPRDAALYVTSAVLLAYTHYYGYFFVAVQLAWLTTHVVMHRRRRTAAVTGATVLFLVPGVVVAALKVFVAEDRADTYGHATAMHHVTSTPDLDVLGHLATRLLIDGLYAPVQVVALAILSLGIAWGAVQHYQTDARTFTLLSAWVTGPVVSMIGVSYLFFPIWQARYLIGCLPPLLIWFSVSARRLDSPRVAWTAVLTVFATSASGAWLLAWVQGVTG